MSDLRRIGKYEVRSELGRGGFGCVYRAFDPNMNRDVAIKVVTESDPNLLGRFRNEAAAAGRMSHENIVTVYEFGEHEGLPFMAMELLAGQDLSEPIAAGNPMPLLETMSIMQQVVKGLDYAHQNGIVHRDVKPGNIRILPGGKVKIMDFGIARFHGSATMRTRRGDLMGTILYMSPEQFTEVEFDKRGDIFACGVIYYQMLAGRHPFGSDPKEVMLGITLRDPEPLAQYAPDCPAALERIILRALVKDRELRYQSLDDLQFDIEPIWTELKKKSASAILQQCEELYQQGQLAEAQTALQRVLELDPLNQRGRELRRDLHLQSQRDKAAPKVEAAVRTAEAQMAERQFALAVQTLEAVANLDPDDTRVKALLEKARNSLERQKRTALTLIDAKRDFQAQNIEAAMQRLNATLAEDPDNPDVTQLLESIRQEIELRARKNRQRDGISKGRGLILTQMYDQAIAVLEALDREQPGIEQVGELLVLAKAKRAEKERRSQVRQGVESAQELAAARRFDEALECLDRLEQQFPGENEIAAVLANV
ncbi:MAG: protein kinase domain-containing protein, partial [Bryobacteraceae bacterium]